LVIAFFLLVIVITFFKSWSIYCYCFFYHIIEWNHVIGSSRVYNKWWICFSFLKHTSSASMLFFLHYKKKLVRPMTRHMPLILLFFKNDQFIL
jgi:hypothetical protein